MDQHVEPPSWLTDRSVRAATETANADGLEPAVKPSNTAPPEKDVSSSGYGQEPTYASASSGSRSYGGERLYGDQSTSQGGGTNPTPAGSSSSDLPGSRYATTARPGTGWADTTSVSEQAIPSPSVPSAPGTGARAAFGRARSAAGLSKPGRDTAGESEARRANLVLARIEPWSVMKFSFMISLVAWLVLFVAVTVLYYALSGLGVFSSIQSTLSSVTSSQGSAGTSLNQWLSASRVLGYTMLIGAVNVVLITALSTVGAMIYNVVTHLGGGIEVTLKEPE